MFAFRVKKVGSTTLSEFIRNAPSEKKKKIYGEVLRRASESQVRLVQRVRERKVSA